MSRARKIALVAAMAAGGTLLGVLAGTRLIPPTAATADTAPSAPCSIVSQNCPTSSQPPPGSTTVATRPPPTPPGAISGLHVTPLTGGGLELRWTVPADARVAAVFVRRGPPGGCPATLSSGVAVGGIVVRTQQDDRTARDGVHYCYAVFTGSAVGLTSGAVTTGAFRPLPVQAAVTGLRVSVERSAIAISWTNPAALTGVVVVRGAAGGPCPANRGDGTVIGPATVRASQLDRTAEPGQRYCYAVFALGAHGLVSTPAVSTPVGLAAPHKPAPPAPSSSSSSPLDSTLVRVAGAVAGGVITFALLLFLGLRLLPGAAARGTGGAIARPASANGRINLQSLDTSALVIPALIVILGVGIAVVAAFLLL